MADSADRRFGTRSPVGNGADGERLPRDRDSRAYFRARRRQISSKRWERARLGMMILLNLALLGVIIECLVLLGQFGH
jgi:hypothetical protein